jgi:hypothetical protein
MSNVWRRLRGALGLGLLWGAGGVLVGGVIELILNILPGPDLFLGVDIWPIALGLPLFLAGLLFSLVLWMTERRRRFDELKLPKFAALGVLGGVALGGLVGVPVAGIVVLGALSGTWAAGSLALARRAEGATPLPPGGTPPAARSDG